MKVRFGAALFIVGLACVAGAGYFLAPVSGPCADLTSRGATLVRLSEQSGLPFPIVQNCANAVPLFVSFYLGYLIAGIGTIVLLTARLTLRATVLMTFVAVLGALTVPYVPNADPYSYALYAFTAFIQHQSPYVPHQLGGTWEAARTLSAMLPEPGNPLRVANYGPVAIGALTLFTGPFGLISVKAMIVAERVLGAMLLLALGWILALSQGDAQGKRRTFAATVLNPLLLFYSVSFAHGDILMLVLLAGAYLAYCRNRIGLSAVLCALAFDTRSVAIVATAVLLWQLCSERRWRSVIVAFASTVVTALAVRACGIYALGGAGHASGFFLAKEDAPGTLIGAMLFGDTPKALSLGLLIGGGIGAAIAYASLRNRAYSVMPVAVLAALPGIEPWYPQWLAPVATLTRNVPYRAALVAFMALAPIAMLPEMTFGLNTGSVHGALTVTRWMLPLLVYTLAYRWERAGKRQVTYALP